MGKAGKSVDILWVNPLSFYTQICQHVINGQTKQFIVKVTE